MQIPSGLAVPSALAREWFYARRVNLKPWGTFVTASNFERPTTLKKWSARLTTNVGHFQSNYLFVSIILVLYCLITSPLLLLVLFALGGANYVVTLRNAESALTVAGKAVPLLQQHAIVCLLFLPVFYISGAGTAIIWVVGASLFIVMAHASFYVIENVIGDDEAPFDVV